MGGICKRSYFGSLLFGFARSTSVSGYRLLFDKTILDHRFWDHICQVYPVLEVFLEYGALCDPNDSLPDHDFIGINS